jgi:hypothetical protein
MISDISSPRPMIFPLKSDFSEESRETTMPSGSFSLASIPKIGYLLPFYLQNCSLRDDFYRTNVVIQENAT